jgi:hypothetical protein
MARDPVTRGLRDEADVGPDPRAARELKRLSELRYKVADGEPDIRGWKVYASTGRELGTVSDLLVDTDAGEVVMLDIDLRRNDRHTLAPVRAAWIDHATHRVVLDAREAERAVAAGGAATTTTTAPSTTQPVTDDDTDDVGVPALPRGGSLSDDDVSRFNDDYARAYGDRGVVDGERAYRLRRGDEELRFGGPRRLLDSPSAATTGTTAAAAGAAGAAGAHFAESERINAELAAAPVEASRRDHAETDRSGVATGLGSSARDARALDAADRRVDRVDRADEVRTMDDERGIDPRELDGRVRIDEGGTVDDRTPVAGVRYEGSDPVPHHYGQPADAYGPEYGSGRIGFDKVVSRGPYVSDAATPPRDADEDRPLRYRRYPDAPTDRRP